MEICYAKDTSIFAHILHMKKALFSKAVTLKLLTKNREKYIYRTNEILVYHSQQEKMKSVKV